MSTTPPGSNPPPPLPPKQPPTNPPEEITTEKTKRSAEQISSSSGQVPAKARRLQITIPETKEASGDTIQATIAEHELIQATMKELEIEMRGQCVLTTVIQDKNEFFSTQHPGELIEYEKTQAGVTDTNIIKLNGYPSYILKKVSLPGNALTTISAALKTSKKTTFKDKLKETLIDNPPADLIHKKPYIWAAQREYLASIVGKNLGVPETTLLLDGQGTYSLHKFQENIGSSANVNIAENLDTQSLQNIVILDLLIENQDRNLGNVLVTKENDKLRLIPIDHALSFQYDKSEDSICAWIPRPPCWEAWLHPSLPPLTEQTKQWINTLSIEKMIAEAKKTIIIEPDVEKHLINNAKKLKSISQNHNNLKEIYEKWLDSGMEPASLKID